MPQEQPTIVITGAGSGLGEAMAYRFARAGYRIGVADINAERAEAVLAAVQQGGGSGFARCMNVTVPDHWNSLYQQIGQEWGRLDVLVNNAGVAAAGRLEDSSMDDWQWVMDTNLLGVIRGCHRFIPLLRQQGNGHIVNVASFAGLMPVPELSAYATAKAAVVALSEQLRVDLAGSGVGVSVLCPAYVQTALLDTFRSRDDHHHKQAAKWMAGSKITADEVAETVFEAVEKNRFLLLTHSETVWVWRFKRWFPGLFFRFILRVKNKMARKINR